MNSDYLEIIPKNEALKSLIKLYYVHRSSDQKAIEKITYFPNYVVTLNIYKNSRVEYTPLSRTHYLDKENQFLKILVGKFDQSREIIMNGGYDKLTIVFHPLGFNHFTEVPLSNLIANHFSFFDHFGKSFDALLSRVFAKDKIEEKRDLLDTYFSDRLLPFKEERVKYAVGKILATHGDISIKDISSELQISRKTLLRLFKLHIGMSPTEYRSIVKFRKSIYVYKNDQVLNPLSSLAYEVGYYDQSDLNAHFKSKTGLSPKQLFRTLETIKKDLYWKVDYVPKVQEI